MMDVDNREKIVVTNSVINSTSMSTIGSQLRNMTIPSPPSLSSSSDDDSDDISDIDEEGAGLDCFNSNANINSKFLLGNDGINKELSNLTLVGPETQAKLEALLEAAGVAADGKAFTDPEVLRRLTSSVSSALDEAAEALTKMRSQAAVAGNNQTSEQGSRSLVEACIEGDIAAVRKLLDEGRSVHEPTDEGESLLSLACSAGYYELVQVLLAMNANVEDRGSKGDCTPLMEAASGGFEDIVQLLLQHGANINAQSSSGNTALHYACCSGYDVVVQTLIQHNAHLEHQNENGHTPLMEAASGGHVKVAKLLLDSGAGINTHSSEFKESALTLACYKGHVDMVFFLLERGADQEHKTDEMHTALMEASMDGHVEVARLLLDHGAQVNMPADSFESPLTLAACGSHVELAQLLIEHGANLEEVNDEGYTPLMEAGREGYLPMVDLLLENGAKINAQTEETQETALTLACCGGFQEVVSYLLEHGAHIELGASTPLMEAATEGHVDLVRFLLEKGANVNASTATGDSALTYAAENGHTDVVEVLIDNGANIEHKSEGGRTPLMKAARAGHLCTVEFLISKGADVNGKTTGDEHSVLSLACAGGHSSIVELLLTCGGNPSVKLKDNSSMLIEAAKGGHANVACLLINAQMHQKSFISPESSIHPGFTSPVSTASKMNSSSYHICEHIHTQNEMVNSNCQQRDCQFHCHQHLQQPILQQQLPQNSDCFGTSHNCAFIPPVNQANLTPSNYGSLLGFDEPFKHDVDVNTSPTDLFLPNTPASALSLANLTPADLQSLAQALSFSSSVNASLQQEQYEQQQQAADQLAQQASHLIEQSRLKESETGVTEDLGLSTSITFPAVDPQVESFTTQSEVCTPSPSDTTTALVTSAGRTIASTGVQTEDAISMIQKLTNSVHQLNALQNFAAAHNLELVNLGEITLPPAPFTIDDEAEDDIMVAESAQTLQNSLLPVVSTREEPIGECCNSPHVEPIITAPSQSPITPPLTPVIDIDQATESNHDTALTIACAGGHDELVQLLLSRGSNIEHRDKKGCTPLILSATAGHVTTCHILLEHGAEIEAQSDRTKDTALSLACSSGRQEVVELLLMSNANFEHRNVSDYTPLSLAASGGYVGIIKILLNHGAEINSRTGSKLGISPLMLAAMNGHVAAVKLLLDRGSDVNAQIETNRNTALTLACFQGRTEVVGLLLDRKANIEHRAKTGLTPLMEAASGGYVDVGTVLIDRGADVNAPPVPSSRDTALTIAADKGHFKFVELLIIVGAQVEVKNKKGCTPLWLGANGGHLDVVQLLADEYADVNATDNRGVSCLMTSFRKGHVKVVKWLVKHVSQFPPDLDCKRYLQTVNDPELLKKLEECHQIINAAKKRQEAEANKNASILLEELDYEKKMEEQRKVAAQKKRDRKKQKKKKKSTSSTSNKHVNGDIDDDERDDGLDRITGFPFTTGDERTPFVVNDERPDLSAAELKLKSQKQGRKKKKLRVKSRAASMETSEEDSKALSSTNLDCLADIVITTGAQLVSSILPQETVSTSTVADVTKALATSIITSTKNTLNKLPLDDKVSVTMVTAAAQSAIISLSAAVTSAITAATSTSSSSFVAVSPRKSRRSDEGWKEVTRNVPQSRPRKTVIPASLISRVIGRGGCNVNAIREFTGALIDIDTNRKKANGDCMVTIKGPQPAVRQAGHLIQCLIDDPERDVSEILPVTTKLPQPKIETPPLQSLPTTLRANNISKSLNIPKSPVKNLTQRQLSAPPLSKSHDINISIITSTQTSTKTALKPAQKPSPIFTTKSTTSSSMKLLTSSINTNNSTTPVTSVSWNSGSKSATMTSATMTSATITSNPSQVVSVDHVTSTSQPIHSTQLSSSTTKTSSSRRLFSPATRADTTLQKPFPQPIGSNRPKIHEGPIPLSSTTAGDSITATLHSTLTSLLSQVATQRSPMIWNDTERRQIRREFQAPVTSISSSPITFNGHCYSSNSISQGSSQDSTFLHQSRTPSLSPTSNHSNSPTPAESERPHLNPIGSERGHRKFTEADRSPDIVPIIPDTPASIWPFEQKSSSWHPPSHPPTHQQPIGWPPGSSTNKIVPQLHKAEEKKMGSVRNSGETLSSLLDRLSLSNHYFLFQKNEIDLDALMLMSDQDYEDIGLPRDARLKLLSSVRQLHTTSNSSPPSIKGPPAGIIGEGGNTLSHHPYMIKPLPTQSTLWNRGFPVDHHLQNSIISTNSRIAPDLRNGIAFQPVSNQWSNWSGHLDQ